MDISDLSFRDLEAIVTVGEVGHFGRAAASLGIAQPTLSSQVRKVEATLGAVLFERAGRRVFISEAGRRVIPLARDLLTRARSLPGEAADAASTSTAPLHVGIIPTLGPYLVPHLLARRGRTDAIMRLSISEHTTTRLVLMLREGTVDAAILSLPVGEPALTEWPVFDEPFMLVVPRGHRLATAERVSPSSLSAAEMVLLEEGHCLRDQALAVCRARGADRPRVVAASIETLKYMVAAGEGYSLLPLLTCGLTPELERLVVVRPFDERTPLRRVGLCARASYPRAAHVEALATWVRERVAPGLVRLGVRAIPKRS